MIAIINYGVGNLSSIANMFRKLGIDAQITDDPAAISSASKLVLPGVGAFDHCMQMFNRSGLRELITRDALENKKPVLGICVGLQMMTEGSEEGKEPGLGWIRGRTTRFRFESGNGLKVPHMGWTNVTTRKASNLATDFPDNSRFYFVHSYHVSLQDASDELFSAHYGYDFTAAVEHENIRGVQFHPEKSHRFGMKLLENFSNLDA